MLQKQLVDRSVTEQKFEKRLDLLTQKFASYNGGELQRL